MAMSTLLLLLYLVKSLVFQLLQALDTTKANGQDGILACMLKATAATIAPSVTKLFELYPQWLEVISMVVPIVT